jgi:hypothetical protein
MPADHESPLVEATLPPFPRADGRRLVEQPVFFLLLRQPGKPGIKRVVGRQKGLLAMEDGGVGAVRIVVAVELACAERQLDASAQGRMRVGGELGINQVRNLPRMPMQLDQVRPLDRVDGSRSESVAGPPSNLARAWRAVWRSFRSRSFLGGSSVR